jgi:uncharacterized protein (DUF2141 family)
MTVNSIIVNKKAIFAIKNLLFGDYAAIVLHNQNSNNKIDHSWGFLSEPLGFTNNWKLSLFFGMPTFEKLKFNYSKSNSIFDIKLN